MKSQRDNNSEAAVKRAAVLEQAIHAFAEFGFRGTDVQVIADRAGVGKGTVYRYFGNKEGLFWAATYEMMERMEVCVFGAMEDVEGACAKLRAAAAAHAAFFENNPHYLELSVQDRAEFRGCGPESHREHHEKMIRRMGEILEEGIARGELRPVDPRQTTIAIGCLLYGAVVLGCHLRSVNVTQMSEHGIDIFLQGLRSAPSQPIAESCLAESQQS